MTNSAVSNEQRALIEILMKFRTRFPSIEGLFFAVFSMLRGELDVSQFQSQQELKSLLSFDEIPSHLIDEIQQKQRHHEFVARELQVQM